MKNFKTGMLCLFSAFCFLSSFSQNPPVNEPDFKKPKIFADLPARMNLRTSELETFLSFHVGQSVNTTLAGSLLVQGTVVSVSDGRDNNVKSVVVRSTNKQGATLTFTRIKNDDGSFKYLGRMMSFQYGDALEISSENGQYFFQKKGLYDLVNE